MKAVVGEEALGLLGLLVRVILGPGDFMFQIVCVFRVVDACRVWELEGFRMLQASSRGHLNLGS